MNLDFTLIGTIVPITPINISRPVEGATTEKNKGVPMMTVVTPGGPVSVPYTPGESFKGLLRALAGDVSTRGRTMGLDVYNTVFKGGIKGSEKESVDDLLKTVEFRRSFPVLGLFGASAPHWVTGCLSVGPGIPDSKETAAITSSNGVRRDDFRLQPERLALVDEDGVQQYMRYATIAKRISRLEAEVTAAERDNYRIRKRLDGRKATPEETAKIKENEEAAKSSKAAAEELKASDDYSNTIGRPLPSKLGIAPGSVLNQRISGRGVLDAEFGLFLETLRELRHDCRLGGLRSIGYGYFEATWDLAIRDQGKEEYVHAGVLKLGPNRFDLQAEHPAIARCQKAWNANGGNLDSLTRFVEKATA